MALGDALLRRMDELSRRKPAITQRMAEIAAGATVRAVDAAREKTPPNTFEDGEIRGVHTITGELSQHWFTDSDPSPQISGGQFETCLANDREYASYVNDGHRMDKHFVPGLYVDDDGLLSYDPSADIGMMVGTKTKYVPGLYMKEAGTEKYKEVAEMELDKLAKEMFQ